MGDSGWPSSGEGRQVTRALVGGPCRSKRLVSGEHAPDGRGRWFKSSQAHHTGVELRKR